MSLSDFDSMDDLESNGQNGGSMNDPSSTRSLSSTNTVLTPVGDFRQSLENEKNIRRFVLNFESNNVPSSMKNNDKVISFLEKNYKLQVQTLLEEVNQLKLDKKILEKKLENIQKNTKKGNKENDTSDQLDYSSTFKMTLDAKDSIIKELEFQIGQLKNENQLLKMSTEVLNKHLEELSQKLADLATVKELLEEKEEEIASLKSKLQSEEAKQHKLIQELSYVKNENLALKIKSQNNSFVLQPNAVQHSFIQGNLVNTSRDQSFISTAEFRHQRTVSETTHIGKLLNFSEINDDMRMTTPNSFCKTRSKIPNMSFTKRRLYEDEYREKERSVTDRNLSLKALQEYEKNITSEEKRKPDKDGKMLDRLIEVKKIKNYYLEMQNKKLISLLNNMNDKAKEDEEEEEEEEKPDSILSPTPNSP
jgi:Uncharacterized conserved protein